MTDRELREVRQRYLSLVREIPRRLHDMQIAGVSVEIRARRAWELRRNALVEARSGMAERERALVEKQSVDAYGTRDGATFEWLVEKHLKDGLSRREAYRRIVESAVRTNPEVNKNLGL